MTVEWEQMRKYLNHLQQEEYRKVAASNPLEISGQAHILKTQGKTSLLNELVSDSFIDGFLEYINNTEETNGRGTLSRRTRN